MFYVMTFMADVWRLCILGSYRCNACFEEFVSRLYYTSWHRKLRRHLNGCNPKVFIVLTIITIDMTMLIPKRIVSLNMEYVKTYILVPMCRKI